MIRCGIVGAGNKVKIACGTTIVNLQDPFELLDLFRHFSGASVEVEVEDLKRLPAAVRVLG